MYLNVYNGITVGKIGKKSKRNKVLKSELGGLTLPKYNSNELNYGDGENLTKHSFKFPSGGTDWDK